MGVWRGFCLCSFFPVGIMTFRPIQHCPWFTSCLHVNWITLWEAVPSTRSLFHIRSPQVSWSLNSSLGERSEPLLVVCEYSHYHPEVDESPALTPRLTVFYSSNTTAVYQSVRFYSLRTSCNCICLSFYSYRWYMNLLTDAINSRSLTNVSKWIDKKTLMVWNWNWRLLP